MIDIQKRIEDDRIVQLGPGTKEMVAMLQEFYQEAYEAELTVSEVISSAVFDSFMQMITEKTILAKYLPE